jgi:hypothetical protein
MIPDRQEITSIAFRLWFLVFISLWHVCDCDAVDRILEMMFAIEFARLRALSFSKRLLCALFGRQFQQIGTCV